MNKIVKYSEIILNFLEERDFIVISKFEKHVGCPKGTIRQAKHRGTIPEIWIFPMMYALADMKFKLDGVVLHTTEDMKLVTGTGTYRSFADLP